MLEQVLVFKLQTEIGVICLRGTPAQLGVEKGAAAPTVFVDRNRQPSAKGSLHRTIHHNTNAAHTHVPEGDVPLLALGARHLTPGSHPSERHGLAAELAPLGAVIRWLGNGVFWKK